MTSNFGRYVSGFSKTHMLVLALTTRRAAVCLAHLSGTSYLWHSLGADSCHNASLHLEMGVLDWHPAHADYPQGQDDPTQFSNETCGRAHPASSHPPRSAPSSHSETSLHETLAAPICADALLLAGCKRRPSRDPCESPDPKQARLADPGTGQSPGQDPLAPSPGPRFLGRPVQVNPIDHIFQFHKVCCISAVLSSLLPSMPTICGAAWYVTSLLDLWICNPLDTSP